MSNKERNEFQPALPLSVAFCWWDDVSENWVCPPRNLSFFISSGRLFPFLTEEDDPPQLFSPELPRLSEYTRKSIRVRGGYLFQGLDPPTSRVLRNRSWPFSCTGLAPVPTFGKAPFSWSLCADWGCGWHGRHDYSMRERLTLPGHRVSYVRNSIYYIRNYALAENASLRDFIMHEWIIYVIT